MKCYFCCATVWIFFHQNGQMNLWGFWKFLPYGSKFCYMTRLPPPFFFPNIFFSFLQIESRVTIMAVEFQVIYSFIKLFHPSFLCSDGNFADAVFRFNANISYSGVLHAVTQDVSVFTSCVIYVYPSVQAGFTQISPIFTALSLFLFRVFSLRTKKSSSTTPSWLCYPRRLSCLLLMLS